MEIAYVPSCNIHPNFSVFYSKTEILSGNYQSKRKRNLKKNYKKPISALSENAERKLKKSINYITYISTPKKVFNPKYKSIFQFRLNFITLTLSSPQIHKDSTINKVCLNQFLIEAKKLWGVSRYVWRSEYQRNGNLHYHIITNVYIPLVELRNVWNRIQNKLGYTDRFNKRFHKDKPNSTDIHSVRNIKKMSSYCCKYMLKNKKLTYEKVKRSKCDLSQKNNIHHYSVSKGAKLYLRSLIDYRRIWGCSQDLSDIKGFSTEETENFYKELDELSHIGKCKKLVKDYCEVFVYDPNDFNSKSFPICWEAFAGYLYKKFAFDSQRVIIETFI